MRGRRLWMRLQTQRGEVRVYVCKYAFKDDEGNEVDAYYDAEKNIILVFWCQDENYMKMKLLHEILHVCFSPHSGDMKASILGDCVPLKRWFREEMVVSFLEPVLFDLLSRNRLIKIPKPPKV